MKQSSFLGRVLILSHDKAPSPGGQTFDHWLNDKAPFLVGRLLMIRYNEEATRHGGQSIDDGLDGEAS